MRVGLNPLIILFGSTHLFDWHAHFEDFGVAGQNFIGGVDLQEVDLLSFFLYKFKRQEYYYANQTYILCVNTKINKMKSPMKICVLNVFLHDHLLKQYTYSRNLDPSMKDNKIYQTKP